jgi:hypothetical protein
MKYLGMACDPNFSERRLLTCLVWR